MAKLLVSHTKTFPLAELLRHELNGMLLGQWLSLQTAAEMRAKNSYLLESTSPHETKIVTKDDSIVVTCHWTFEVTSDVQLTGQTVKNCWRLLEPGEQLQPGDEYLDEIAPEDGTGANVWKPCSSPDGWVVKNNGIPVRRTVSTHVPNAHP